MSEEFGDLSSKIVEFDDGDKMIYVNDVKEFIKKLKEVGHGEEVFLMSLDKINKLAGSDLI